MADAKKDKNTTLQAVKKQPHVMQEDVDQANGASWWSLFQFTSKLHTVSLALAVFLSVASGIIIPALALFLGKLFDGFTNYGAKQLSGSDLIGKASTYGLYLVVLGCVSGILNAVYFMSWLIFGELQAKSARVRLFNGLLEKDMEWYDMQEAGIETLTLRMQMHVRELQTATSQPMGFVLKYTVTIVTALGLAFFYSWSLTLVTIATIPISALVIGWISKRMQPDIEAQAKELTRASKLASNAISAIETIKCSNGQDFELSQYAKTIKEAAKFYFFQAQTNALQIGFVRMMTLAMFVQGFWYGSHLVNIGRNTPGDILTCFWACLIATQTVEQVMPHINVLEKGRMAGATLEAVVSKTKQDKRSLKMFGKAAPDYCEGDMEIRDVSFSYPLRPDQLVLKGPSFFFAAGETTFVVGQSGSGKSTLANLLMRFYDPGCGHILIDGNRIESLDINWIRNNITLVQQQSVLFNDTIRSNIVCGRHGRGIVSNDDVKEAIDRAVLQGTIREMPQGLNTLVGADGSGMSGGQRQRIELARARLRDTPILILDEAVSALDHITKSMVVERVRDWREGKTTIIITHDMYQVRENDYVYVLHHGTVVQEGYRHALEKSHATGPFSGLEKTTTKPLPSLAKRVTKSVHGSGDATIGFLPASPLLPEDSMEIEISPKSHIFSSPLSPATAEVHDRRVSTGFTLGLSPASFPTHHLPFVAPQTDKMSEIPRCPLPFLPHPSIEDSIASQRFINYKDIEMKPLFRVSVDSRSGHSSTQSQALSTASTLIDDAPEHKCKSTKVGKATLEAHVAPLKDILFTIWPTLTSFRRMVLILGFVAAFLHAAATPAFSYVFSQLLSTFYLPNTKESSSKALICSLSILGVAAIDGVASYLMHYLLETCGQHWIDALRTRAYRNILDQPLAFFSYGENSVEKLAECLDRNAEETRNLLGRFAAFAFVAVTMMMIAMSWSLALSWRLTLVGLASAPCIYAVTRSFEYISGRWETRSNISASTASGIFAETFSNIRTVRALTLEQHFHEKYVKAVNSTFHVGLRRAVYSGLFFGLSDTAIVFVTALILYYGAHLVVQGTQTVTEILTVMTTLLFSIAHVNAIIAFVPQISSSRSTASDLLRLAQLPYGVSHECTGTRQITCITDIKFERVSFAYPSRPTVPVLRSLDFNISATTSTALVGASGSGKSTIASLILNLYPSTSGYISVNNYSIAEIQTHLLRKLIAIVPQHPMLFPASIAANISYPHQPNANNMKAVQAAAKAVAIDDFIVTLSEGYNTIIGAGGTGLSGGQAQRVAIARAVYRGPQLLILDEATSGLDEEKVQIVGDLVRNLDGAGVGVIVITHEEQMIRSCRDVVVIRDQTVREIGTCARLMKEKSSELAALLGRDKV